MKREKWPGTKCPGPKQPLHAKIFIEFVALIIRNKIYTCLKDRMKVIGKKENYMTVPAAIRELNKIELIRQADGIYRLDHAVTAITPFFAGDFPSNPSIS